MKGSPEGGVSVLPRIQGARRRSSVPIVHHVVFICGLSSAGKDSLLSRAAVLRPLSQCGRFLSKWTTRGARSSERIRSDGTSLPIPYGIKTASHHQLSSHGAYFGFFAKYGNHYAFSRAELISWLRIASPKLIVGIYSGIDCLVSIRQESGALFHEMTVGAAKGRMRQIVRVQSHWALVDAPADQCLERVDKKGLDERTSRLKKDAIRREAELILLLKNEGFFDVVIDNSAGRSLDAAVQGFVEFLRGLEVPCP